MGLARNNEGIFCSFTLAKNKNQAPKSISKIELLDDGELEYSWTNELLAVELLYKGEVLCHTL